MSLTRVHVTVYGESANDWSTRLTSRSGMAASDQKPVIAIEDGSKTTPLTNIYSLILQTVQNFYQNRSSPAKARKSVLKLLTCRQTTISIRTTSPSTVFDC